MENQRRVMGKPDHGEAGEQAKTGGWDDCWADLPENGQARASPLNTPVSGA